MAVSHSSQWIESGKASDTLHSDIQIFVHNYSNRTNREYTMPNCAHVILTETKRPPDTEFSFIAKLTCDQNLVPPSGANAAWKKTLLGMSPMFHDLQNLIPGGLFVFAVRIQMRNRHIYIMYIYMIKT